MLIVREDTELSRIVFVATGWVVSRAGKHPMTRTILSNGQERLAFGLCTGSTLKSENNERSYQTINCSVYTHNGRNSTYNIVKSLKYRDIVFCTGHKYNYLYVDRITGETRRSSEYQIEFIIPQKAVQTKAGRGKLNVDIDDEEEWEKKAPIKNDYTQINSLDDGCEFD